MPRTAVSGTADVAPQPRGAGSGAVGRDRLIGLCGAQAAAGRAEALGEGTAQPPQEVGEEDAGLDAGEHGGPE